MPAVHSSESLSAEPITLLLAALVGVLAGYGAVLFNVLIHWTKAVTLDPPLQGTVNHRYLWLVVGLMPALGLLFVAWFTRRFAPEAQGHGVPEVIAAVGRHEGVIRPRISLAKILASGICIGTGGSVGREGPIVQIGSSLGSSAGQWFGLEPASVKALVAAGAAAGISATFNAPLAGVVFASEIILGNFAVKSLTPIVIASVLANVVQLHVGEHGMSVAFPQVNYAFLGAWEQLPSYIVLGLCCGLAAVGFTRLLYLAEDLGQHWLPQWWLRALVCGGLLGVMGVAFQSPAQVLSPESDARRSVPSPPLFGVGYEVVDHALHLENVAKPHVSDSKPKTGEVNKIVRLDRDAMLAQLWWLLPLLVLKPLATSITLSGGGSGGIFAPSLFIGASLGASFGLACNLLVPDFSANPGVYAIVGMGAVVAGTTHGVLSAILIVYELTGDYRIILPIMVAAGLASVVASRIDVESIYVKKLSRRGETSARGHDLHRLEHIMVREVMVRQFPTVRHTDDVTEIVRVARANSHIESLPVMNADDQLLGIIRAEDLHRMLDSDVSPMLVNAEDIALRSSLAVAPTDNLLEALRDFGSRDVESLPVEDDVDGSRRLVGLLLRADVMRRYRQELLRKR